MIASKIRDRVGKIRPITRLMFAGYVLAATLLVPVEGVMAAVVNVAQAILCGYLAGESGRHIYRRLGAVWAGGFAFLVIALWVLIKGIWLIP